MACPCRDEISDSVGAITQESRCGKPKPKPGSLTYEEYLQLDKLLTCQKMASENNSAGEPPAHDEHVFVITHQAYELWFKQILFEIDSIRDLLATSNFNERETLIMTSRLKRIVFIFKLLVDQFSVLETMAPPDFMEFRDCLTPASGFQSIQFRLIENIFGVKHENRLLYNHRSYLESFLDEEEIQQVKRSLEEPSLLQLVEKWLERTPGLDSSFNFWEKYLMAAWRWIEEYYHKPALEAEDDEEKNFKMGRYLKQKETYNSVSTAAAYNESLARGEKRLSYKAFQGALMISLYRNEPRFHEPFQVLTLLVDIDSLIMKWRYNHLMLVQRIIGSKLGTGLASGYMYLRSTVSDRYKVFVDLFNLPTYLIPRKVLPSLNAEMKRRLSTFETNEKGVNVQDKENKYTEMLVEE